MVCHFVITFTHVQTLALNLGVLQLCLIGSATDWFTFAAVRLLVGNGVVVNLDEYRAVCGGGGLLGSHAGAAPLFVDQLDRMLYFNTEPGLSDLLAKLHGTTGAGSDQNFRTAGFEVG